MISLGSCKGLDACYVTPKNQIVDVVGSFICLDRLEIGHMPHNWVFI